MDGIASFPRVREGKGGGGVDFAVEENEMDMSKTKPFLFIPMTHDFNIAGPCTNPGIQNDNYSIPPIPNPHSRIQTKTRTAAVPRGGRKRVFL